ncbi:MAG: transglycosylase domain-containing protein, partial [Actinomycetia bacterium]|nr:transglycosylase domain-containing protein [Actinomycetes bacterium]
MGKWKVQFIIFFQAIIIVLIGFVFLFLASLTINIVLAQIIPADFTKKINLPEKTEGSKIFSFDEILLGTFSVSPKMKYVEYSDIPPYLMKAIVSVGDEKFYSHKGIDIKALLKAVMTNFIGEKAEVGSSTLTQQYVNNVFIEGEKNVWKKAKEIILALRIERELSKDEILERYINQIYFGSNYYGIEAAAYGYFNKPASKLNLSESALLAGLVKFPNYYYPFSYPDRATNRRNFTLK